MIGHAVQICASSIGGIEIDSSLLLAMPPAFFLAVVACIDHTISRLPDGKSFPDDKQLHILHISVSYLQHFGGSVDEQYFRALEKYLSFPPRTPGMEINSCATIALDFLKLMKKYWWKRYGRLWTFYRSPLEEWCTEEIEKYLSDSRLGPVGATSFISSMVEEIPGFAARELLKRGFSTTRHFKRCYD